MPKKRFDSNLDLSKFNKKVLVAIDREIITTGYEIETEAKRNVPVDTGRLRGSINTEVKSKEIKIGAYVNYASDVEFGRTPGSYAPPKELEGWVKRKLKKKGDDIPNTAYNVSKSIYENGVKAQPFLYPAFKIKTHDLLKRLLKIIENETAK